MTAVKIESISPFCYALKFMKTQANFTQGIDYTNFKMHFFFLLGIVSLFFFSPEKCLLAQTPDPLLLTLSHAVKTAIKNNVGLQVEKESISLQLSAFDWEEAQFDPTLSFDLRADRTIRSSTSLIETGPSGTDRIVLENQRLNAGINQRLRSGGDLDVAFRQSRSSASFQQVNPALSGNLVLSFTQPLLQGSGHEVNESPIRIAKTDIELSQAVFESQVSSLVLNVSNAYWDLVFQLKNLAVQKKTLASAQQLLSSSRTKVEIGVLSPIEILVAEAGVASREEAVFIAQKGVGDTEDQLRVLLDLPELSRFNPPVIHPIDQPKELEQQIESTHLIELALSRRLEIRQNHLLLQNQALASKIAKNKLSPSFDFVGRFGLSGLGKDFSDEVDQLDSGTYNQWEAGFVFSFPIGNHAARADLQREKTRLRQTLLQRKKVIQQVTLETKEGLRRVRTNFQRIKATQRALKLAEEKLSAGNERFTLGLISSHDLLEFQDDLAEAKGNGLKAIIDYNKSLVNLEHVTGQLLSRYQIETVSFK